MKFINTRPTPIRHVPAKIIHFGPNLSESQPVSGNSRPLFKLAIPAAKDATARLKPSSEAMGLKSAEIPNPWNPYAKPERMPVTRFIHQPKNISGNLLLLIKKLLSPDTSIVQPHRKRRFGGYKHRDRLPSVNIIQVTLRVDILSLYHSP